MGTEHARWDVLVLLAAFLTGLTVTLSFLSLTGGGFVYTAVPAPISTNISAADVATAIETQKDQSGKESTLRPSLQTSTATTSTKAVELKPAALGSTRVLPAVLMEKPGRDVKTHVLTIDQLNSGFDKVNANAVHHLLLL